MSAAPQRRQAPEDAPVEILTVHPMTPDRWDDLETLFGPKGASGGCWCMLWRLRKRDWKAGKGEANRAALRTHVETGPPPGVIAYIDDIPAGWCSIAPRGALPGLAASRILKPVDDWPVWSVTCFFIPRRQRRRGVSHALLRAAGDLARTCGASVLEGYPIDPKTEKYAPSFAWTGFHKTFVAAGFVEVARRSDTRPIMRLEL